ncbi:pre-mRNA processing factor 3 (PRP3) (DUF1115) [Novymonas esmeraldas]|uniref:Pre-mRNA processing factor 3 (PRP3) (DUF1115) n=1 Tax=Novymonas esmeraldas TaxID=1808958 RepID=A0AAW0ENG3_9TRYP
MPLMPPPTGSSGSSSARHALSIDDVVMDFSQVAGSTSHIGNSSSGAVGVGVAGGAAAAPPLLHAGGVAGQQHGTAGGRDAPVSDVRAYDPALQGLVLRYSAAAGPMGSGAARRRKLTFGGPPAPLPSTQQQQQQQQQQVSSASQAGGGAAQQQQQQQQPWPSSSSADAAEAALDFLTEAQHRQQEHGGLQSSAAALQARRDGYVASLQRFCQHDRPTTTTTATDAAAAAAVVTREEDSAQTTSLLRQLFADGVPDMEPWDRWTSVMPRYTDLAISSSSSSAAATVLAEMRQVHHPVIPDSHYTRCYAYRDLERPTIPKTYKTKEELRQERRERLQAKQVAAAAAAKAAKALPQLEMMNGTASTAAATTTAPTQRTLHDRLSTKSLAMHLFGSSVLNPLAADTTVLRQYELRNLEHQRRNHDRHVAALPDQILKRTRDQRRHATEAPVLRAYRIYPIYSAAHLGKLRHYANDNLLRGFILYISGCDALVVLTGGEVAARHLDRWILHKMAWEHPDTRASRLCTVPLVDAETFSFHLKRGAGRTPRPTRRDDSGNDKDGEDGEREHVFINHVSTVADAAAFLRQLPAPSGPWADLCGVWRVAFLGDGLKPLHPS